MGTYAIGDIQGCFDEFRTLLERIRFDPAGDRLWIAGDLVNRGPQSLETLRFVRGLGEAAVSVLGNHDLHLLAVAHSDTRGFKPSDTVQPVLHADDGPLLLEWLRHRPLLHHDAELGYTMVHAGFAPQWDLATARTCAREVEAVLRSPAFVDFFDRMYGNEPDQWSESLKGYERLRFATNCLTRIRYVDRKGRLKLKQKVQPGEAGPDLIPWFRFPGRPSAGERIVFGHWSTLGLHTADNVRAIDTGCLWGGSLTALRLEDDAVFSVGCRAKVRKS